MRNLKRLTALIPLTLLTGCSGFFVYPGSPTGTGTGTGTGSTTSYVYVANATTSNLAAYSLSAGKLTALANSPLTLGLAPNSAVVTPANTFLYVAGLGAIFGYSIGTGGVLTPLTGGNALAAAPAVSMDVSPDGKWLFVLDAGGITVDEYAINTSNGTLSVANGASFAVTGGNPVPSMVRVSPNGAYVVAAMGTGGDVVFTFNTTTGLLTAVQTLAGSSRTSDNAIAFDVSSSHLYIARSGDGTGVAAFTIGNSGALASLPGSPFAAGTTPAAITLDSTGAYLYAANRADGTLSGYAITSTGTLTPLTNSPFTSGTQPTAIGRDGTGKYILAASFGGSPDLTVYSFDTTTPGKLIAATTAATGIDPTGPVAIALSH